ncbi:hypothetical protein LINPERHAP1_LOCUS67, partial [Linum perenne]
VNLLGGNRAEPGLRLDSDTFQCIFTFVSRNFLVEISSNWNPTPLLAFSPSPLLLSLRPLSPSVAFVSVGL